MLILRREREQLGIPDEDFDDVVRPGWKRKIASYFKKKSDKARYIYDYGDDWEHVITLEEILPRDEANEYPLCSGGARACPPEDCGGVWGYADFLEAIMDPAHESLEEMLDRPEGSSIRRILTRRMSTSTTPKRD
ncbi:MAG: plasmid pRiA4b ORF-3 family protein [Candidatus Sulfobium sp.]